MPVARCQRCRRALVQGCADGALCSSCAPLENARVVASPAMTTPVGEIQDWLDYHDLGLSVSFAKRVYNVDLRRPVGDGSSVSVISAQASDFDVALVAACQNYERVHAQHIA